MRTVRAPWWSCGFMLGLVSALLVMTPSLAQAQDSADTRRIKITGDRLSGFVLPIEPVEGDIELQARNANAWTIDDTKRLFLEGDVLVSIGAYQFHAQKAVVWINRMPSEGGTITQIAIHFDKVDAPRQPSGLAVAGKNLLITGSAKGDVNLSAWSIKQSRPRGRVFLQASEERLATHLKQLLSESQTLAIRPQVERPAPKPEDSFVPVPGGQVLPQDIELPKTIEMPTLEDITPWLRDPEGTISYMAQKFTYIPGDEEDIITLTGSFVIEYIARRRANDFSQITLSAQRAVIFTDPGLTKGIGSARLSTENIRGIYLEGNVHASADDGDYVARAPQMYYDFTSGQAIMLEAILRTYMRDIRMPIYARAEEMRQIATSQWEAKNVVASTSEFFTPHLAIGAKRMTITRRPTFADPTEKETYLKSADNTLQAGGMPFFYWPEFKGTIRDE
ncbi:MAG: hypothetical protein O7G85_05010, partial [Planctomycetota bacterium]|nr:hypothetical protein [Planctomycetota bacterium]